jgi:5'(3')-deoxyribonucleotidase
MPKQKIFFDLDGVLANFVKGYKQAFNRNAYEDDTFTITQFCLQVPHFFRLLPIQPEGYDLFCMLKNNYDIVFLTTPIKEMEYCKRDKIDWAIENLGQYDVLFSDNKAEYVVDNQSILIDDMDHNLSAWKEAGGTAIRFPQSLDKILTIIDETFNPIKETKKIKQQLSDMEVEKQPTDSQIATGLYKKGKVNFKGLDLRIENPKGSIRIGIDDTGRKWVSKMKCHYGYILGTEGADFDPVDCYIGDGLNRSLAFVINQSKSGVFDEVKIMLGCKSEEEARNLYLSNYEKGWEKNIMSVVQTNTKQLRSWLKDGRRDNPFI